MKNLCLLVLLYMPLLAQDDQIKKTGNEEYLIDLQGNVVTREKIAVPDFKLEAEDEREAWDTINTVLRADLANSGFFEVLSKERLALIRSPHEGPILFEDWASIEAQHLVVGNVRKQRDELRIEVRLYEIASRQSIIAKAFTGKPALARKIAHKGADLILTHLRNSQFASSKIIFSSRRKSQNDPGMNIDELFIMDYDGFNPLPITRGGIALSPSAAKIGRETYLVYAVFENPFTINATYGIYLKPTLLSRPTPLFQDKSRRTTSPAMSPDGKKIAFTMVDKGNTDIWVMGIDGSDLLQLTSHPGVDTNPSWAPGGRSLLFTSDRTGTLRSIAWMPMASTRCASPARTPTTTAPSGTPATITWPTSAASRIISIFSSWTCRPASTIASPACRAATKIPTGRPMASSSASPPTAAAIGRSTPSTATAPTCVKSPIRATTANRFGSPSGPCRHPPGAPFSEWGRKIPNPGHDGVNIWFRPQKLALSTPKTVDARIDSN